MTSEPEDLDAAVAEVDVMTDTSAPPADDSIEEVTAVETTGGDVTRRPDAVSDALVVGPDEAWHVLHQDLDEALLSVWGRTHADLWAVGADKGAGPIVLHGTAEGWTRVVTGTTGDLWWVFGPDDDEVVMVGEHGTVLRYVHEVDALTALETGTDATLFGVWGTSERLWAVGGTLPPADGPPVLLRIEGEVVTAEPLPDGIPEGVLLFKVWGTSPDDVWVIGEQGVQLHFDGLGWTHVPVEGAPRLVTLHGDGQGLRVAVGGAGNAVLLEDTGAGFEDRSPPLSPALNGVFVGSERSAAVGMLGSVHLRTAGAWSSAPALPLFVDLHAVWLDPRQDVYTVGGGLLSVTAMDRGALLRWGPPRDDIPAGPITLHQPANRSASPDTWTAPQDVTTTPDIGPSIDVQMDVGSESDTQSDALAEDIVPVADVPEVVADVAVSSDVVDDTAQGEVETSGEDTTPEDVSLPEVSDGAALDVGSASDVGVVDAFDMSDGGDAEVVTLPDGLSEGDVEPAGPEVSDVDDGPASLMVALGEVTPALDFTLLEAGQNLEIVQGPQGGVHVEVGVRVALAPELGTVLATIDALSFIGGEEVGAMVLDEYGLYETDEGYVSWAIPVIFFTNLADPYVGETLDLAITVTLETGEQGTGTTSVHLIDWY